MNRLQAIDKAIAPVVPKEFVTYPFFPAKKQSEATEFMIKDVKWSIGVPPPASERPSRREDYERPPFDMRHGRVCFALLTFRDRIQNDRELGFSINELARRVAKSNGGRYSRDLVDIIYDLNETWVKRSFTDGAKENFQILGEVRVYQKPARRKDAHKALSEQDELWFDYVTLSPEFFGLLKTWEELARIRFDVLISLTSDIAQSIYTFLPSRAVHHTRKKPWSITLSKLMGQIGLEVPKHKSTRKKIFTQNKTSIIDQLDGAATLSGTLNVKLVETRDRSDYKIITWVEDHEKKSLPSTAQSSKLLQSWLDAGRTKEEFKARLKTAQPLNEYHIELIIKAGATVKGNEEFFRMIHALLGPNKFEIILSEAKGDCLEGRPGPNPTGRLIWRLMDALNPVNNP